MRKELIEFNFNALKNLRNSIFNNNEIDSIWNKFMKRDPRISWTKVWSLVVLGIG